MNALDLKTRTGKTIADMALAPLLERGIGLLLVDAGARGGMHDLPASYAAHIHLIGFEPNPEEFAKLVDHNTDARQEGYIPSRWKKESFKDVALWDREETRPIYIYNDTGAVTLMGELVPKIANNMYSGFAKVQGGGGENVLTALTDIRKLLSVEDIKCNTLDSVIGGQGKIDYLKIDVEGAEIRVLRGARELLEAGRILFIKSEFVCLPLHKESGTLPGPQLALLHDHGYRLLDFGPQVTQYARCQSSIPKAVDRGLAFAGDVFFALDPDRVDMADTDLQRLGLISIALGFRSFGLSVMRDAKLLSTAQLADIEAALAHVRLRRKLRLAWERFPASIARKLYAPARYLRAARG